MRRPPCQIEWRALALVLGTTAIGVAGETGWVRDGLVLSWEAASAKPGATTLSDGSGQGNPARLAGAARLAGDPPRVELGGKGALIGAKPALPERITVEAVFRADRTGGPLQHIATTFGEAGWSGTENPRQWVLQVTGSPPQAGGSPLGHLSFGVFGGDGQWHLVHSAARLAEGWHHAAGTFDGRVVRLYLDGRAQPARAADHHGVYRGRIHQPADGAALPPAAGSYSGDWQWAFEGAVALVRIYARALSRDEIERNLRHASQLAPPLARQVADRPRPRPKPPFKVLFSNDTTNILTCVSPYHKRGQPFDPAMLEATVEEARGADVHMLQPGFGSVPWWTSTVYPDHYEWWERTYGTDPGSFGRTVREGGDLVAVFVRRCRARGIVPFVSLRLNDAHGKEHVDSMPQEKPEGPWSPAFWSPHAISRFYKEHPEYRLGPDPHSRSECVHNWAIAAVREHKFAFIREICERYDIDGFELDFMRLPHYFRPQETPLAKRREIMTDFVAQVRRILDRTAKPGQHRWLCARLPCKLSVYDSIGIDLPAAVAAGIEMVNLSPFYFTQQDHDLAAIRESVPEAAVYLEMCHCTTTGRSVGRGYDSFLYRRTTDPQYYTAAHVAYRRGADGVSLFNFVYTREHGTQGRGPFNEPPFHVLERLKDPQWLARQPQWYFLAKGWHTALPRHVGKGQTATFTLDMAPTEHQRRDGLLRVMTGEDASACRWTAAVNGTRLDATDFVAKPLDHPYDDGFRDPKHYACFTCPRALIQDGPNKIAVSLIEGGPATLVYLDVVLP